jgi:hypothetical protein
VTVVDARTGRELLKASLKVADVGGGAEVRVLHDRAAFYLLCSRPIAPTPMPQQFVLPQGVALTTVQPGAGLRTVPANGKVYAFDRAKGEERWEAKVAQQLLFVDDFAEMPVLLLAGHTPRLMSNNQFVVPATAVTVISKRTGKLLYDEPDLVNAQPFHTLRHNPAAGTVELACATFRITLSLER